MTLDQTEPSLAPSPLPSPRSSVPQANVAEGGATQVLFVTAGEMGTAQHRALDALLSEYGFVHGPALTSGENGPPGSAAGLPSEFLSLRVPLTLKPQSAGAKPLSVSKSGKDGPAKKGRETEETPQPVDRDTLDHRLIELHSLRAAVALGVTAHLAILESCGMPRHRIAFRPGTLVALPDGLILADSPHAGQPQALATLREVLARLVEALAQPDNGAEPV